MPTESNTVTAANVVLDCVDAWRKLEPITVDSRQLDNVVDIRNALAEIGLNVEV
jgi:hypothetical protein